jgi:hypothetical protein
MSSRSILWEQNSFFIKFWETKIYKGQLLDIIKKHTVLQRLRNKGLLVLNDLVPLS